MLRLRSTALFAVAAALVTGFATASTVGFVSADAVAEEMRDNDVFALDEISQSGLQSVIGRDIVIYNIDFRVTKGDDGLPFHKFSIWRFSRERNSMNFCIPDFCGDPLRFEYRFDATAICLERTSREIAGCYTLAPKSGQLDWIDENGHHVMTSFTAVYIDIQGQSEDYWKIFRRHQHQEMVFLHTHKEEIILGLKSLGVLDDSAKYQFDRPVRAAIVTLQRKAGIFPTGFIDLATFKGFLSAAADWYLKAAEEGDKDAQYKLATAYYQGWGVPQDDVEAARWYRQAAEQGHAEAQHELGAIYHQGRGVKRNETEAVKWYRMAAEQGNAKAVYKVGLLYMNSARRSTSAGRVEAFMWLRVAASRLGPEDRDLRDHALRLRHEIETEMTPQEIKEAEALASKWMLRHPL